MDFRHLIVTCLFSKLRLPFDNQKVKENYAIFIIKVGIFKRHLFMFIDLARRGLLIAYNYFHDLALHIKVLYG